MQPRVLHRLADIETLQRYGNLFQNILDSAGPGFDRPVRATADIDGDHAVNRGLRGYGAEQPDLLCGRIGYAAGGSAGSDTHRGDAFEHLLRRGAGLRRLRVAVSHCHEERDLLLQRESKEMLYG